LAVGLALISGVALLSIFADLGAWWLDLLILLLAFAAGDRLVPLWPAWLERRRQR
jgi:hypothetical protein